MSHTTIRVSTDVRDLLREMARDEGVSMLAVVGAALEAYRRRKFLEQVNAAYSELRSDEKEWGEFDAERREWDATLGDGLPATRAEAPAKRRSRRLK